MPFDSLRGIDLVHFLPGVGSGSLNQEFPFKGASWEAVICWLYTISSNCLRLDQIKFYPDIIFNRDAELIVGSFSICQELPRIFLIYNIKGAKNILLVEELVMRWSDWWHWISIKLHSFKDKVFRGFIFTFWIFCRNSLNNLGFLTFFSGSRFLIFIKFLWETINHLFNEALGAISKVI